MLKSIRKKQKDFVTTLIVFAVAAVMAVLGIGQFSGKGGANSKANATAASVNGERITVSEFQQELQARYQQYQSIFGKEFDPKILDDLGVPQQTLHSLIQHKLLAQQSEAADVRVSDYELAKFITAIPYFQKEGKFSPELYKRVPNIGTHEARQRELLRISRWRDYLNGLVKFTPEDLKKFYNLQQAKMKIRYAKIDFGSLTAGYTPTPKEIEKVQGDTKAIQEYYDSHSSEFIEKAAIHYLQIRVGIPFQASAEKIQQARTQAETLAKTLTAENFSKVAKESSDDPTASSGGDRGWQPRTAIPAPVLAALDTMAVDSVSPPIQTENGFYLVKLIAKRAELNKPLEQVKSEIATRLARERYRKDFEDTKKKEWEAQLAAGKSIEKDLKNLKIDVKTAGPFAITQGTIPQIGEAGTLLDALFELKQKGQFVPRLPYHNQAYYMLQLVDFEKPNESNFSKEADSLKNTIAVNFRNELIEGWLAELEKTASIERAKAFEASPKPQLQF